MKLFCLPWLADKSKQKFSKREICDSSSNPLREIWEEQISENKAKWFCKIGYLIEDDTEKTPLDILLKHKSDITDLKEKDAKELLHSINTASLRVRTAFKDDKAKRKRLFNRLFQIAKVGLYGEYPAPKIALNEFEVYKSIVPVEADNVRTSFLRGTIKINVFAIIIAILTIILWLPMHSSVFSNLTMAMEKCPRIERPANTQESIANICSDGLASVAMDLARYTFPGWDLSPDKQIQWAGDVKKISNLLLAFSTMTIGTCLGLILISFLRNREITYENFDEIYLYRLSPLRYFILIEVLALILMILVAFDMIIVGVGAVRLNDIVSNWPLGLILGLLCSISEPLVSGLVINQVRPTPVSQEY